MEVKECMEKKIIQELTVSMENLLQISYQEFQNLLVNLSGSLKDIECGTLIKIPIPAGYVSCYRSEDNLKLSLWYSDTLIEKKENSQEKLI